MTRRRWLILLTFLLCAYIAGPCIAGSFRIGDRRGPIIYPESFHEVLYIMAHEGSYQEKPRLSYGIWLYHRPFFYGLPLRLKSPEERRSYIEKARQTGSASLQSIIMMNEIAEAGGTPDQVQDRILNKLRE